MNNNDKDYYQDLVKEYKETLAVAVESINELEQQNAARREALEKLVLAFDVGDIAHTTLNGWGYPALAKARQVIAEGKETTKNKE